MSNQYPITQLLWVWLQSARDLSVLFDGFVNFDTFLAGTVTVVNFGLVWTTLVAKLHTNGAMAYFTTTLTGTIDNRMTITVRKTVYLWPVTVPDGATIIVSSSSRIFARHITVCVSSLWYCSPRKVSVAPFCLGLGTKGRFSRCRNDISRLLTRNYQWLWQKKFMRKLL